MKKYINCALTVLFAAVALTSKASDKESIISKETAAWQAFKDKKADDFKKLLYPEFMAVYKDGIYTLQKEMDLMPKMDIKSFTFSDINVAFPDADTATITCKVALKASAEGNDASGDYNSASIWRRQNGEWRGVFHMDMQQEKAASK